MPKIKFTAKLAIGAVTTATAAALVLAMGPAANADPITPGGRVHTHTGAHGGHAAQDLSWTTPATHTRHAKIKNQTTTDSASSVITINDPSAPTSYDFNVNLPAGATLVSDDAGGYDVVTTTSSQVVVGGHFNTPWAKDANGKQLKTHYTLRGNTITQDIDTSGAEYPITADPFFTNNCGWVTCTVYFTRGTTHTLASKLGKYNGAPYATIAAAFGAACLPFGGIGGVVCAGIGTVAGSYAIDQVLNASKQNRCFTIKWSLGPLGPVALNAGVSNAKYCKN